MTGWGRKRLPSPTVKSNGISILLHKWSDPEETDHLIAWTRSFWIEVEPFTHGTSVNWLADDDGLDRIKAAYGPNYSKLVKLKHKYDPDNLFRLNNNILPSSNGLN
ncbi:MAG: BBE domain-containing protein [Bacteroidales bacterium]